MIISNRLLLSRLSNNKMKLMFSRGDINIDLLRQKAFLAQIIMREIETSRNFSQIKECSLVDRIIKTVESHTEINPLVREEMLKFFKNGVSSNKILQELRKVTDSNGSKNGAKSFLDTKIVYFPTTLVSSQIFYELRRGFEKHHIITGHSGVSKSLSVHLFWYLSNIICQYKCLEPSQEKLKENEILTDVPKLVYWNSEPSENSEFTRKKILNQFFEIGENLEDTNYLKIGSKEDLIQFYNERNINVILLIDQFNEMINLCKRIEENELKNEPLNLKDKIKNFLFQTRNNSIDTAKEIKENKEIRNEYFNCLDSLANIRSSPFFRYIYLSSAQLDKESLNGKLNIYKGYNSEKTVAFKRIRFENLIYSPMATYEFIDYFMFEVKQKLNLPTYESKVYNNESTKKIIRDKLFEKLREEGNNYYLTPLFISEKLREIDDTDPERIMKLNLAIEKCEESVENVVTELKFFFDKCTEYSEQNMKERVKFFLSKGSEEEKKAILAEMFNQSYMNKENQKYAESDTEKNLSINNNKKYENEPKYAFEIKVYNLVSEYYPEELKHINTLQTEKINSHIDKNLFYYDKHYKALKSYFHYEDIQKFLGQYHENVIEWLISYSEERIKHLFNNIKEGRYFENLFIEAVSSGHFNVSFPYLNRELKKIYGKKMGFHAMQNTKEKYYFLKKFQYILRELLKENCEVFPFVPIKFNLEPSSYLKSKTLLLSDINIHSPSIDLILVELLKSEDHTITLFAFDFTVTSDPKKIREKYCNFFERYRYLNDKDTIKLNKIEYKIQMKYYVISAQENEETIDNILNSFNSEHLFRKSPKKNELIADKTKLTEKGLSTLLNAIGHIHMGKSSMKLTKITSNENIEIDILWYFDRLSQIINS